ncbi:hypothetical protein AC1031_021952 [Aphanomyces cochlioides]|nr:hypothetical protein AC1031_021952 [Aphanomyces cochlioides]
MGDHKASRQTRIYDRRSQFRSFMPITRTREQYLEYSKRAIRFAAFNVRSPRVIASVGHRSSCFLTELSSLIWLSGANKSVEERTSRNAKKSRWLGMKKTTFKTTSAGKTTVDDMAH